MPSDVLPVASVVGPDAVGVSVGEAEAVGVEPWGEVGVELVEALPPHAASPRAASVRAARSRPSIMVDRDTRPGYTPLAGYARPVCRSIKTLRGAEPEASDEEIRAAALQFVRKVSGYRAPSQRNRPAFDDAVEDVTASVTRLLDRLETR